MVNLKRCFLLIVLVFLISVGYVFAGNWTRLESGTTLPIHDVFFLDQYNGWAVGGAGLGFPPESLVLHTTNGGDNWTRVTIPTTNEIFGVCFANLDDGWLVGSIGTILHTTNGGATWEPQTSPTNTTLWDAYCLDSENAVAVGFAGYNFSTASGFGNIIKTSNGGSTWISKTSRDSDGLLSVSFGDRLHGFAVGDNGKRYRTIDGGNTWVLQPTVASYTGIVVGLGSVYCSNEDHCFIASGNDFYNTTDGGSTLGNGRLPYYSGKGIYFKNDTVGWIVGEQDILYTADGGTSWVLQPSDIPGAATDLGLIPVAFVRDVQFVGDVGWAVGDDGLILRYGTIFRCPPLEPPVNIACDPPNILEPVADSNGCLFYNCTAPSTICPPAPSAPSCESPRRLVSLLDENGCTTGYNCTGPSVSCPAVMYDCEVGWTPAPVYDSNGCVSNYTCVHENLTKGNYSSVGDYFSRLMEQIRRIFNRVFNLF